METKHVVSCAEGGGPGLGRHVEGGWPQWRESDGFSDGETEGIRGGCCSLCGRNPGLNPHRGKSTLQVTRSRQGLSHTWLYILSQVIPRVGTTVCIFTQGEKKAPRLKTSPRSHKWSGSGPSPEPKTLGSLGHGRLVGIFGGENS